jgi:hypothetical protein
VPWDAPGSTAIVVMTREAEPVVGSVYREHSSAGRDGMTPHVTLVVPFVPAGRLDEAIDHRLRRMFRRFAPFKYVLRQFQVFESSVLYLTPEPSPPFVDLVQALAGEFPEYPPYEGIHDDVIPHLTVAESEDGELLERIRSAVEPQLPIECSAAEATLVERGADLRWRPRSSLSFGSVK